MKKVAASKGFRSVVHGITVASTVLAAYGSLLPPKYAIDAAAVSAVLSGILHFVNTYAPDAAPAQ